MPRWIVQVVIHTFIILQCHGFHQFAFSSSSSSSTSFSSSSSTSSFPSSHSHTYHYYNISLFYFLFLSNSLSLYVSRISYYTTPFSPPIIPFKFRPTILCLLILSRGAYSHTSYAFYLGPVYKKNFKLQTANINVLAHQYQRSTIHVM